MNAYIYELPNLFANLYVTTYKPSNNIGFSIGMLAQHCVLTIKLDYVIHSLTYIIRFGFQTLTALKHVY